MLVGAFSEVDCARCITIFVNGLASSVCPGPCCIHPPLLLLVSHLQKRVLRKDHPPLNLVFHVDKEFPLVMFINSTDGYFQDIF